MIRPLRSDACLPHGGTQRPHLLQREGHAGSLDLTVDNMTDQHYLDALSLGMVPAPGRTLRLGAILQW